MMRAGMIVPRLQRWLKYLQQMARNSLANWVSWWDFLVSSSSRVSPLFCLATCKSTGPAVLATSSIAVTDSTAFCTTFQGRGWAPMSPCSPASSVVIVLSEPDLVTQAAAASHLWSRLSVVERRQLLLTHCRDTAGLAKVMLLSVTSEAPSRFSSPTALERGNKSSPFPCLSRTIKPSKLPLLPGDLFFFCCFFFFSIDNASESVAVNKTPEFRTFLAGKTCRGKHAK